MSSFTSRLAVTPMGDGRRWELLTPFRYCVGSLEKPSAVIEVPAGFRTDFASIPRALWLIFPPHGQYTAAAIVHDFLYVKAWNTRRWADMVFREAMGVLGVPKFTRYIMWAAVRMFGRGNYE